MAFQYIQGLTRKVERDFFSRLVVTGQGARVLDWKRAGLDCT